MYRCYFLRFTSNLRFAPRVSGKSSSADGSVATSTADDTADGDGDDTTADADRADGGSGVPLWVREALAAAQCDWQNAPDLPVGLR